MAEEQTKELELQAGDKKIRIRGSDILGMLNMFFLGVILYGGWDHLEAAKDGQKQVADAIKESSHLQRQMVQALQEQNCIARLTPQERQRVENIEFCRAIGRGR